MLVAYSNFPRLCFHDEQHDSLTDEAPVPVAEEVSHLVAKAIHHMRVRDPRLLLQLAQRRRHIIFPSFHVPLRIIPEPPVIQQQVQAPAINPSVPFENDHARRSFRMSWHNVATTA